MTSPDRPHDPSESAANTLRSLGYLPGPQPIRQLRQVGAEALAGTEPEASGETAEAHTRLIAAAVAALGVLTESDLDEMKQQHLADAFGLHGTGEAS